MCNPTVPTFYAILYDSLSGAHAYICTEGDWRIQLRADQGRPRVILPRRIHSDAQLQERRSRRNVREAEADLQRS